MGLGLEDFLNQRDRGGGGRKILDRWKDDGDIVVWLHIEALRANQGIARRYGHTFLVEDEVEDKDRGGDRKKLILRYPRFVSPDPVEIVDCSSKWRDRATGIHNSLVSGTHVIRDPFLIVREHLYHLVRNEVLATDEPIFAWTDHKNRGANIQWLAGHLTGHVERGRDNFGSSLDAKCEYVFVVVQQEAPGDGAAITFETKMLGDSVRKLIKDEIESNGDAGDPRTHPYAMRWSYDKRAASPMQAYSAARYNRAECTDEVWAAITTPEWPDVTKYVTAQEGDMEKIRAAMEVAAQVELPFDSVFSDDPEVRLAVARGELAGGKKTSSSGRRREHPIDATPSTASVKAPVRPGAAVPTAATRRAAPPKEAEPAPSEQPQSRRKKAIEKPPEPMTIPCEDCGKPMLVTDTRCGSCGAEYEIDDAAASSTTAASKAPDVFDEQIAKNKAAEKTATPRRPKPQTSKAAAARPEPAGDKKCWSCGSTKLNKDSDGNIVCSNCGIDQGDDLPYQ